MEKYHFVSFLFVPAPEFAGDSLRWIDTFNATFDSGSTESVNIIVLNVKQKEGIKPMLNRELYRLQKQDNLEESDKSKMGFIERTLQEMKSGVYEHKAPDGLMKVVSYQAGREIKADDVIYLSGISSISQ